MGINADCGRKRRVVDDERREKEVVLEEGLMICTEEEAGRSEG